MKKSLLLWFPLTCILLCRESAAQQPSATGLPSLGRPGLLLYLGPAPKDTMALRKRVTLTESHDSAIPKQLPDSLQKVLRTLSSDVPQRVKEHSSPHQEHLRHAAHLGPLRSDTAKLRKAMRSVNGHIENLRLPEQAVQPGTVQQLNKNLPTKTPGANALRPIILQKIPATASQQVQEKQTQLEGQLTRLAKVVASRLDTAGRQELVTPLEKIQPKPLFPQLDQQPLLNSLPNRVNALSGIVENKIPDLAQRQLNLSPRLPVLRNLAKDKPDSLLQLPSLPGSVLKADKILYLDSLRKAYLSAEKLQLTEGKIADDYKEVVLKPKESLLSRSYFEGIVGLGNQLDYLTFSPSVGIRMIQALSGGLGINVGLNTRRLSESPLIGIRSFAQYELLRKRLNLQLENNSYFTKPAPATALSEGARKGLDHLLYVGAGYLIHYSKSKSINVTALYQLNKNQVSPSISSPFMLRLGLSVFKPVLQK